jgi:ABC-type Fe3+ transport system permease subunit
MTERSTTEPEQTKRKKHRVFLWVFLVIQAIFIVWVVGAIASPGSTDCNGLDAQTCQDASNAGTAIGVGLVIVFWAFVDIILGICYGVYRLAKRP